MHVIFENFENYGKNFENSENYPKISWIFGIISKIIPKFFEEKKLLGSAIIFEIFFWEIVIFENYDNFFFKKKKSENYEIFKKKIRKFRKLHRNFGIFEKNFENYWENYGNYGKNYEIFGNYDKNYKNYNIIFEKKKKYILFRIQILLYL